MQPLSAALFALAGAVAGGALVYGFAPPREAALDTAEVRAVVETVLTERAGNTPEPVEQLAELDPETLNPMIESFLMDDPTILQRLSVALETQLQTEQSEQARVALAEFEDELYAAEGDVILGNPDGDVTLVELFDYNCTYCRQALPDLAALLESDPDLKVILKEFPILSQESVDAARVGVLVAESDVDYWDFHQALFTGRGQVTGESALQAATDLGLSRVNLELDMGSERVAQVIQNSYELAQGLGITGTPTFIIGDQIIPGAVGADQLRVLIENMRECGQTQCG
jgi:protein-disulfide isomerase